MGVKSRAIDWSRAPLAKFARERTQRTLLKVDRAVLPPPSRGSQDAPVLISVDAGWSGPDLIRRLSGAGLKLQMDTASNWKLVLRESQYEADRVLN